MQLIPFTSPMLLHILKMILFEMRNLFLLVLLQFLRLAPCLQKVLYGSRMPANQRQFVFDLDFLFPFRVSIILNTHTTSTMCLSMIQIPVEECNRFGDGSFVKGAHFIMNSKSIFSSSQRPYHLELKLQIFAKCASDHMQ